MPLVADLKTYSSKKLLSDLIAGLTVAVILVPQGMAYSLLAGMPPMYGLYAALVPLLIYPFFASSRELSVGAVALMSIIILASVSAFAEVGSQLYIDFVLMTALMAGIFQVLFSVLGFGVISNFLSRPVMSGFISAAGTIIAISQIKYLLSLDVPRSSSIIEMVTNDIEQIGNSNIYSLLLGGAAILIIVLLKKIHRAIPSYLIAVILGTLILYFFNLDQKGIPILGDLQGGLPSFYIDFIHADSIISLIPASLIIALICFIGSYSISRSIADKQANYNISSKQELMGLGLAKIVGSFFLAMPSTGSFTRSAVNEQAGAKTGVSSIFSAIFIGLTLAFLSQLFFYLPEPILAAIVITSVFSLLDYKEAIRLFKVDRKDFWVLFATFVLTLSLGVVNGIIAGIGLSLLSVIIRHSKPHFAELGQLPGTRSFRNILRYKKATLISGTLILRYDQDLFFANADHFYSSIVEKLEVQNIKKLVLHVGAIQNIDSTAMYKMEDLIDYCKKNDIMLTFTNVSGPLRDLLWQSNIYDKLGDNHFQLSVADAVLSQNENRDMKNERFTEQKNH